MFKSRLKPLPSDFDFGVATADHQCEAYNGQNDVRDVWEAVRGLTLRRCATNFWDRYSEDIRLAQEMGCKLFRLSLSWARLEPTPGHWDSEAMRHYRNVLQSIRDAGMTSIVTLHHNTWPVHVQEVGGGAGMLDSSFPNRFADYARKVAQELGDLIAYYVTINEPDQLVFGYIKGWWMRAYPNPPGLEPFASEAQQMDRVIRLIPNLFRAHAQARCAIREKHPGAKVGSNPLIFGWPPLLRWYVDHQASRVRHRQELYRQAKRISTAVATGSGEVDLSIAQLTLTPHRMNNVLFSEPYFVAHLCALYRSAAPIPTSFSDWQGSVACILETAPAGQASFMFPRASLQQYPDRDSAVAALCASEVDLVFDDDVFLTPYVNSDLALAALHGNDQPFAVAMALGKRALLNAVDAAIREFKAETAGGESSWRVAMAESLPEMSSRSDAPMMQNRKTVAFIGKEPTFDPPGEMPEMDGSLSAVVKRGVLRIGVQPNVPGLCTRDANGNYEGLEPTLARYIASRIFAPNNSKVQFVPLSGDDRMAKTQSFWSILNPLWKMRSLLTTIAGANWWNLGMAGQLPAFLCPEECIDTLDFVGLDYYWGVGSVARRNWDPIGAAMECHYAGAPVWPRGLYNLLRQEARRFPDKPLLVIENGCVTAAQDVFRADYIQQHIREVQAARGDGVNVIAYVCWSITSNREWGLPFDDSSDFGLYHIDLDHDRALRRVTTAARERYARIIAARSAE